MKPNSKAFNGSKLGTVNEGHPTLRDILSDEEGDIFRLINYVLLSSSIALFGIISNAINLIVFYRQGFNTTSNISFFALAVSDMLCLVLSEWYVICLNPYLESADLPFVPKEIIYLSGGWLHVCFGRITSWITVFITAERCMGITFPLKVKQIITLRRTTLVICTIFIVNLCTLLPEYVITYWDWKFVPARNHSLIGLVFRSYKDKAYGLTYIFNSVSGIISFVCVIVLTTFLVTKLAQKSKWRKMATGGKDDSEAVASRDKRTVKMIIMIAIVLIICYIPVTTVSLVTPFIPEFMIDHVLSNSYFAFWSIAYVFDTINSSVNVFLYYRMSTKYRKSFNELFSRCIKSDTQQHAAAVSELSATGKL